jgi:hypothetical protein
LICKEKKVPGLGFAKLYPLEAILKAIFFVQKRVESNSRERNEFKMVLEREREGNISYLGNENLAVK